MPRRRLDQQVASIVKPSGVLAAAKDNLREARKSRCRTVQQYLCDVCDRAIPKPEDGVVVQGNIYIADPTRLGGLVGDNFPKHDGPIQSSEVRKSVFCKNCFLDVLGFNKKPHDVSGELTRILGGR